MFNRLVEEAQQQPFSGWDFSWLHGRWEQGTIPWSYRQLVTNRLGQAHALLDMGTGGGEFLSSLAPLPPLTVATESYAPNIPIARGRLEPLGIRVVEVTSDDALPLPDASFDLVINKHESFSAREVARILKPGGRFITQQVGGQNDLDLNEYLGAPAPEYVNWGLQVAADQLRGAGLVASSERENFTVARFRDIGAVVYYLKAAPWQVPDFSVERYRSQLERMHERITREGALPVREHRFYLEAVKPA